MSDIEQAARAVVALTNDWLEAHEGTEGIDEASFMSGVSWLAEHLLTDEAVERAVRAQYISIWGDDLDPEVRMPPDAMRSMHAVLSAALGKER